MAQQTINIGSSANDGTGDPLRTAFDKINDNFSELYGTSAFGQQITLSGNKVSSNVSNANLVLEASGTGAIEFEGFQIRDNHIEGIRSNEDIRISANGTGNIFVGAIKLNGTTFSADDSTLITFAEGVDVTGAFTGTSASLSTGVTSNVEGGNSVKFFETIEGLNSFNAEWFVVRILSPSSTRNGPLISFLAIIIACPSPFCSC